MGKPVCRYAAPGARLYPKIPPVIAVLGVEVRSGRRQMVDLRLQAREHAASFR
jgi:hypothetical protein